MYLYSSILLALDGGKSTFALRGLLLISCLRFKMHRRGSKEDLAFRTVATYFPQCRFQLAAARLTSALCQIDYEKIIAVLTCRIRFRIRKSVSADNNFSCLTAT